MKENEDQPGIIGTVGQVLKFAKPLNVKWEPRPDITAYELAQCLPFFFYRNGIREGDIDTAQSYSRHFIIE